jgi:hypothetical protein
MGAQFMSATDAANILGYSRASYGSRITQKAREGKIPGAVKLSSVWLIPRVWVEAEQKKAKSEKWHLGRPKKTDENSPGGNIYGAEHPNFNRC